MSSGYYSSSSSFFFHLKASWMAIFSKHLMLHLSTKPDNIHHYNGLTLDHTPVWFFVAD
jgi:hypothetical protein